MLELLKIPSRSAPMGLLFEADPCEKNISQYLFKSDYYAAKLNDEIVGVCLVAPISSGVLELYNIAIKPNVQSQGIGSQLLTYVIEIIRKAENQQKVRQLELSTGTFGHQLSFYQRHGFRVTHVVPNHFLDNYREPIFENGIQHKDMLRLVCQL